MNMNVASMKPACITAPGEDAARQRLHGWQTAGQMPCFSYTRTVGGLVLSGRGRIATSSATALTIDALSSSLFVVLDDATFDDTPQIFFTPDLGGHFQLHGIGTGLG
ncbi:hypothetical protein [Massilia soli]|uniref:AraC family transcriptional regulator n=1 Tax=Massilia soli TaxID=2792854 RepID=A0ABS7SQ04_9BURK|nr:hypothetical protein [Massilia soli]MBZ2208238.1 hypothetical protein [Massilia soli]